MQRVHFHASFFFYGFVIYFIPFILLMANGHFKLYIEPMGLVIPYFLGSIQPGLHDNFFVTVPV